MTREIPHSPVALYEVAHLFWSSRRGNHLGQRSCVSAQTGRTYGRKRSDQSTAKHLARRGPSTYGKSSRGAGVALLMRAGLARAPPRTVKPNHAPVLELH